jgi:hypothetical protein
MKLLPYPLISHRIQCAALLITLTVFFNEQVQAQSCANVTFECVSTAGSKYKCGFAENSCQSPSTPPNLYLQQVINSHAKWTYSSSSGTAHGYDNGSEQDSYDPLNNCLETSHLTESGNDGDEAYSCATTITSTETNTTGDCTLQGAFSGTYSGIETECEFGASQGHGSYSTSGSCDLTTSTSNESGSYSYPNDSGSISDTYSQTLTTLYTDNMLRANHRPAGARISALTCSRDRRTGIAIGGLPVGQSVNGSLLFLNKGAIGV